MENVLFVAAKGPPLPDLQATGKRVGCNRQASERGRHGAGDRHGH
ncbi:MAG TPA: hypothetical protein VFR00_00215 [Hyphomicrobiaceae bacterium]|jgi:hypothetical protein|nr:hypothetical protein [Hyphomicrobiaceae bacterium]